MQVPEDEVQQLCPGASQKAFLAEVKAAAAPAVAPASPACAKSPFPRALRCHGMSGDRHDRCPCLAQVQKGHPGLGTL